MPLEMLPEETFPLQKMDPVGIIAFLYFGGLYRGTL
jgi:hypothetical protein